MTARLSANNFMVGLLAALALEKQSPISIRGDRFDAAVEVAFDRLTEVAQKKGINPVFRIRVDKFHGDSVTVRDAIYNAVQRDVISLDNPEYPDIRLKLNQWEAEKILHDMPGGEDLFTDLAKQFLVRYQRTA